LSDAIPGERCDCCVVGGGPGGLLLALLLARRGRSVTILERAGGLPPAGAGPAPVLQPPTLEAFDRLGLLPELERDAEALLGIEEWSDGRLIFSGDYGSVEGAAFDHALCVPLGTLLRALAGAAERGDPPPALRLGAEVEDLPLDATGGHRVVARLGQERREIEAGWIVGCDGRSSAVRGMAGIRSDVTEFSQRHLRFTVPRPAGWPSRARFLHAPPHSVFAAPIPGQRLVVLLLAGPDELDGGLRGDPVRLAGLAAGASRELGAAVEGHLTDWSQVTEVRHVSIAAATWQRRNVVLLGDSAHAMHSLGGQGLNQTLQDAVLLAAAIDESVRSASPGPVAEYEASRRPRVTRVQEWQVEAAGTLEADRDPARPSMYAARFGESIEVPPELAAAYRGL
jgi:2-polyprenyl-6-methoxyphenol hydroxylase-like FAD-dependent oxidoreductase